MSEKAKELLRALGYETHYRAMLVSNLESLKSFADKTQLDVSLYLERAAETSDGIIGRILASAEAVIDTSTTPDELDALLGFYNSPAGAKWVATTRGAMQEAMRQTALLEDEKLSNSTFEALHTAKKVEEAEGANVLLALQGKGAQA